MEKFLYKTNDYISILNELFGDKIYTNFMFNKYNTYDLMDIKTREDSNERGFVQVDLYSPFDKTKMNAFFSSFGCVIVDKNNKEEYEDHFKNQDKVNKEWMKFVYENLYKIDDKIANKYAYDCMEYTQLKKSYLSDRNEEIEF